MDRGSAPQRLAAGLMAALLTFGAASTAQSQIIVQTYPRRAEPAPFDTAAIAAALKVLNLELTDAQRSRLRSLTEAADAESGEFLKWHRFSTTSQAAEFWGSNKVSLLPATRLSPGSDETTIFTELAAALSGGWRFVLATALAVGEEREDDDTLAPADQENAAFSRFIGGGGNLSFAAARPIGTAAGGASAHLLFLTPRAWGNLANFGLSDDVTNFGAEMAMEYHYQRYEQKFVSGALGPRAESPFLVLTVRAGNVYGSKPFYDGLGRKSGTFLYTVPSVILSFRDDVRVGVSYFWAFGALREHEKLRFHVTLNPERKESPE